MREREDGFACCGFQTNCACCYFASVATDTSRPSLSLWASAASSPAAVVIIFFTIKGKLNLINIKGSSRSLAPFIRRVQQTRRRRCVSAESSCSHTQPFSLRALSARCLCGGRGRAGTLFSDLVDVGPLCVCGKRLQKTLLRDDWWLTPPSSLVCERTRAMRAHGKWIYW